MKKAIIAVIFLGLIGCASGGYVPHYILTDHPESKEVEKKTESPHSQPSSG